MTSKTADETSPLARLLPGAQFGEHHVGVLDADIDRVWQALHEMRWSDLRWSRPFLAVRGILAMNRGGKAGAEGTCLEMFWRVAAVTEQAPTTSLFAMVGQPWHPVPRSVRVRGLDEVADFQQPGWLKYGMEWLLHPLPGDRTAVETRTLCLATDERARRRFRAYWAVIRPFSGILRREMIATLGRLARDRSA